MRRGLQTIDRKINMVNDRISLMSKRIRKLYNKFYNIDYYIKRKGLTLKGFDALRKKSEQWYNVIKQINNFQDSISKFNKAIQSKPHKAHLLYMTHEERNKLRRLLNVKYRIDKKRNSEWGITEITGPK
jgi:hypothetical protein